MPRLPRAPGKLGKLFLTPKGGRLGPDFFFGEILFYLLWKPGSKVKHVVLETNGAKRKNLWDRLSMIVKFHGIPNYALDHSPK
jgi:hypothetical protein